MKNNVVLILDFDRTLFDTDYFKNKIKKIFNNLGIDQKKFKESYQKTKPYSISKQLKILKLDSNIKKTILQRTNQIIKKSSQFIFPEVKSFLNFSKKNRIKIILVTLADKKFQKSKIDNSRIGKFFDEIIINGESKINIFKKIIKKYQNKKIIIIDDLKRDLSKITKEFPATYTIEMNHKNHSKKNKLIIKKHYFKVNNFYQVKKIINSL